MKIQTRVLKDIYLEGKKVSAKKISENTGLKFYQVHNAIRELNKRKLIKITKTVETENIGYKNPPTRRMVVEINDAVLDRIKKVIKKGELEDEGII